MQIWALIVFAAVLGLSEIIRAGKRAMKWQHDRSNNPDERKALKKQISTLTSWNVALFFPGTVSLIIIFLWISRWRLPF